MSRFIKSVSAFLAGLVPFAGKASDAPPDAAQLILDTLKDPQAVSLRPLNFDRDNLFAAHRSHSSHRSHPSHRSHYSGQSSRGYAPAPVRAAPAPYYSAPAASTGFSSSSTTAGRSSAAPSTRESSARGAAEPSRADKLKHQIMRVQLQLTSLGFYNGKVDGVMGPQTVDALRQFQSRQALPVTGRMTTETMNALGVPLSS